VIFITNKVAGDLLPNATTEDKLATAFYRLKIRWEVSAWVNLEELSREYVGKANGHYKALLFLGLTIRMCSLSTIINLTDSAKRISSSYLAFSISIDEYGN